LVEDILDVSVVADILPSDAGSRHAPPSGPIPEVIEVRISATADIDGTRYEKGEDVLQLLGEEDIYQLEDHAIAVYIEDGDGIECQEPTDDELLRCREAEDEYNHFKEDV
jgi:hypothetical protein